MREPPSPLSRPTARGEQGWFLPLIENPRLVTWIRPSYVSSPNRITLTYVYIHVAPDTWLRALDDTLSVQHQESMTPFVFLKLLYCPKPTLILYLSRPRPVVHSPQSP